MFTLTRARPESSKGPIVNQPILRHTGGSDGQASALPALLYDDVRGHFTTGLHSPGDELRSLIDLPVPPERHSSYRGGLPKKAQAEQELCRTQNGIPWKGLTPAQKSEIALQWNHCTATNRTVNPLQQLNLWKSAAKNCAL